MRAKLPEGQHCRDCNCELGKYAGPVSQALEGLHTNKMVVVEINNTSKVTERGVAGLSFGETAQ